MANNLHKLLILLRPLGVVYGFAMRLRAALFSSCFLRQYTFSVPIISVGNLTMGGSGKTPVVIHLARFFLGQGYHPAVVSRGYGGKALAKTNVVSDGTTLYLDSSQSGDEPRLIAEEVPQAVVLTGKRRKDPCLAAVKEYGCDIIILDDGFQHLPVARDVDLVLFNNTMDHKQLRVVPAGVLREPLSALQRADCFIITGCVDDKTRNNEELSSFLENGWREKPVYFTTYVPHCLHDKQGNSFPLDYLNIPALSFCGIASPRRFQETLAQTPIDIVDFVHFPDHHQYTEKSLNRLIKQAQKHGAEALLTTEKDMVKIKAFAPDFPLYALAMNVEIPPLFKKFLLGKIANRRK